MTKIPRFGEIVDFENPFSVSFIDFNLGSLFEFSNHGPHGFLQWILGFQTGL